MARPKASVVNWKTVLGVVLSVALLYFALRDVDPGTVVAGIRGADPVLFLLSIVVATVMFAVRAVRWRPLLRPVRDDIGFRSRFAATTIGFMANNLLPARIGELVRAYALARIEKIPAVASFGSLVVARLLDGFTIIGFLFLAMALPGFPEVGAVGSQDLSSAATLLLAVFTAVGVVLLAMVVWPERALTLFGSTVGRLLPPSARDRLHGLLETLLTGAGTMRDPVLMLQAVLWSVAVWLVGGVSFWLGFRAFDIAVPFTGALFLQSLISLAVALPSAPGFFGLYEAGVRVGLVQVWGVPVNQAMSFAIGFHLGGFLPVTLIGLYYAGRLGISWREVEESEEVAEEIVDSAAQNDRHDDGAAPDARRAAGEGAW